MSVSHSQPERQYFKRYSDYVICFIACRLKLKAIWFVILFDYTIYGDGFLENVDKPLDGLF